MSGKEGPVVAGSHTRVFWDVVDFPFPKGLTPERMYHYMEQGLAKLGYGGDLSVRAYVDSEVPDKSGYDKAGITIITHQRERDRYMLVDIAWWEVDLRSRRGGKANLLVISKKIKKESVLLTLLEEMSDCCNVLAAAPHRPSTRRTSLRTVSFQSLYTSLFPQPIDQSESVRDPKRMKLDEPLYDSPLHTSSTPTFSMTVESMPSPCFFWDISPPKPRIIHRYMNLVGFGSAAMPHVDTMEDLVEEYKKAGITIIPRPRGAHTMSVDIVLWAMENPATFYQPRTLVIFSNNVKQGTDFYNVLEALRYRNYSVFVIDQGSFHPTSVYGLMHPLGWIMSKEESIGLASLINLDFQNCPIHVFLDVQGLPIELSRILSVVRKKGYLGKVLFRPYQLVMGSGVRVRSHNRDDIASLPTITVRDKSALVTRMLLDMLFLAMNTDDQPQNVMLITKDTKCDFVMQALERRGFNVIFEPSDKLVSTDLDSFKSLCKSPPDVEPCFQGGPRKLTDFDFFPFIIYWLVGDFPSNPNPDEFRYILSSTLEEKGHGRCDLVTAYFDKSKFSDNLIKLYCKAGMGVRFVREDEKITQMALDMTNKIGFGRFNFLVISKPFKDAWFDSVVGGLKERGCNVVFETVDYMLTFGSSHWCAKSILDGSSSDPVYWKYLTRTPH